MSTVFFREEEMNEIYTVQPKKSHRKQPKKKTERTLETESPSRKSQAQKRSRSASPKAPASSPARKQPRKEKSASTDSKGTQTAGGKLVTQPAKGSPRKSSPRKAAGVTSKQKRIDDIQHEIRRLEGELEMKRHMQEAVKAAARRAVARAKKTKKSAARRGSVSPKKASPSKSSGKPRAKQPSKRKVDLFVPRKPPLDSDIQLEQILTYYTVDELRDFAKANSFSPSSTDKRASALAYEVFNYLHSKGPSERQPRAAKEKKAPEKRGSPRKRKPEKSPAAQQGTVAVEVEKEMMAVDKQEAAPLVPSEQQMDNQDVQQALAIASRVGPPVTVEFEKDEAEIPSKDGQQLQEVAKQMGISQQVLDVVKQVGTPVSLEVEKREEVADQQGPISLEVEKQELEIPKQDTSPAQVHSKAEEGERGPVVLEFEKEVVTASQETPEGPSKEVVMEMEEGVMTPCPLCTEKQYDKLSSMRSHLRDVHHDMRKVTKLQTDTDTGITEVTVEKDQMEAVVAAQPSPSADVPPAEVATPPES